MIRLQSSIFIKHIYSSFIEVVTRMLAPAKCNKQVFSYTAGNVG